MSIATEAESIAIVAESIAAVFGVAEYIAGQSPRRLGARVVIGDPQIVVVHQVPVREGKELLSLTRQRAEAGGVAGRDRQDESVGL